MAPSQTTAARVLLATGALLFAASFVLPFVRLFVGGDVDPKDGHWVGFRAGDLVSLWPVHVLAVLVAGFALARGPRAYRALATAWRVTVGLGVAMWALAIAGVHIDAFSHQVGGLRASGHEELFLALALVGLGISLWLPRDRAVPGTVATYLVRFGLLAVLWSGVWRRTGGAATVPLVGALALVTGAVVWQRALRQRAAEVWGWQR